MKVIIPVAGAGLRLRPHTYTQPKPLIPLAGKAILGTIIDRLLCEPNLHGIVLVIGYLGEKIENYIKERYPDLAVTFIYQEQRLGIAHAIWTAKETFENDNEVFICLGDIIFDGNLSEILNAPHSSLGIKKVEDPRDFGIVELNEEGKVKRLIEKPKIPKSNTALVGLYKIKEIPLFLQAIDYIISNNIQTRDEFQLTDALMYMLEKGTHFNTYVLDTWFDCGKKDMLLMTNAVLLRKLNFQQELENKCFPNSIIIPPVSIGKDCKIVNSIIGPNVSIGDNSRIEQSIISNSIIGNFAALDEIVLNKSIIGNDTNIRGNSQSLNIGDNTEIDFN